MRTFEERLSPIGEILSGLVPNIYHYWRPKRPDPFVVWAEGEEDGNVTADGRKTEQRLTGTIDYYTKTEFDPAVDRIQNGINELAGTTINYTGADYEDSTYLIHHSWDFWVM